MSEQLVLGRGLNRISRATNCWKCKPWLPLWESSDWNDPSNPNCGRVRRPDCYVIENGVTSLFTTQHLQEEILPQAPPATRQPLFEKVIKKFLAKLVPARSVTIVDPDLFATREVLTYPAIVANVLSPALATVNTITFVRDRTKDAPGLPAAVATALRAVNNSLIIADHTTSDFHDRFWIKLMARAAWCFAPTLNGVGQPNSRLLDYLNNTDVAGIVQELTARGIARLAHTAVSARSLGVCWPA